MKQISLIKKAQELGLCKVAKHPITKERVILPPDGGAINILTDEWEELQTYANNRRNIKVKLSLNTNKENEVKNGNTKMV